jgi:hypothetical protein
VRIYSIKLRASNIETTEDKSGTNMALISFKGLVFSFFVLYIKLVIYLYNICFNKVIAVATLGFLPVAKECNSIWELIKFVVNSVSAAVPAPQQ